MRHNFWVNSMAGNLAVVTGNGSLADEVISIADRCTGGYTRYVIKPWLPILRLPKEATQLAPFNFSTVAAQFAKDKIERIFFTANFPLDRFVQARFMAITTRFDTISDSRFNHFFRQTNPSLSNAVRYLIALGRFLDDIGVLPVLANEVFPSLNLSIGCVSARQPPSHVLDELAQIVVKAAHSLDVTMRSTGRVAQSVIVNRGDIIETERFGTDKLLRKFGKNPIRGDQPYLIKLPSVHFHPALDQPTIGLDTVINCQRSGIQGIIVCAETTIVARKEETLIHLNRAGMFLYAVPFEYIRSLYEQNFPTACYRCTG
jgi:DUF1009 family protein